MLRSICRLLTSSVSHTCRQTPQKAQSCSSAAEYASNVLQEKSQPEQDLQLSKRKRVLEDSESDEDGEGLAGSTRAGRTLAAAVRGRQVTQCLSQHCIMGGRHLACKAPKIATTILDPHMM